MALPRRVEVCGRTYRVVRRKSDKMDGALGTCENEKSLITISSDLSAEEARHVFIHEVAHAAFWASGFNTFLANQVASDKIRDAIEEQAIDTWVPAILAALKGTRKR